MVGGEKTQSALSNLERRYSRDGHVCSLRSALEMRALVGTGNRIDEPQLPLCLQGHS